MAWRGEGGNLVRAAGIVAYPVVLLVRLLRRSIQTRVVVATLVLSTVVAVLVGWLLLRQVAEGVLDAKESAARTQAFAGIDSAQFNLNGSAIEDARDIPRTLQGLIDALSARDQSRDDYEVALVGPFGGKGANQSGGRRGSPGLDVKQSVPGSLLERVVAEPDFYMQYSRVHYINDDEPTEPALVYASTVVIPATGQQFALFYIFPLTEQQQTLSVLRQALITAGALLVLLLGSVAWLVTRQVVTPVQMARRIAERVAAGRLEERMAVKGQDDIARLSLSFNQMAQTLQRQIRELEELSRVQQRFVSDVSHELRTPLTTVRMAADMLHDGRGQFDAPTGRAAELLQAELDRFETLLTDLLEISRFDAGASVLELEKVDLRVVVRRVVETSSTLARQRGTDIVTVFPERPCTADADARRIERIIRNLVVNAIEHGRGREVVIEVRMGEDVAALTVRDFGVGLRAGEDSLIFGRFWRADPSRARTHGGTGLGLAIAREDALLHGGRLEAWGEWGVGAQFRLLLPRRSGEPVSEEPLPLRPRDRRRRARTPAPSGWTR